MFNALPKYFGGWQGIGGNGKLGPRWIAIGRAETKSGFKSDLRSLQAIAEDGVMNMMFSAFVLQFDLLTQTYATFGGGIVGCCEGQ